MLSSLWGFPLRSPGSQFSISRNLLMDDIQEWQEYLKNFKIDACFLFLFFSNLRVLSIFYWCKLLLYYYFFSIHCWQFSDLHVAECVPDLSVALLASLIQSSFFMLFSKPKQGLT